MSIRFRLGLALAAALTPVLCLGLLQAAVSFQHDASLRRTALTEAAQRSAASARAEVESARGVLETLSTGAVGLECGPRVAGVLERLPAYRNLIRFNALGRVQCAGASVWATPGLRQAEWFAKLRAGGAVSVSSAPVTLGGPGVLAATRASGPDGRFEGALVAVLGVTSLRPDLTDRTLPPGSAVAFVDDRGRTMAAADAGAFSPLPPGWLRAAEGTGGLVYTGRDLHGHARVQAVAPLVGHDLFVVLSAPAPGILTWARLNALTGVFLPLAAWLAALGAVWIVADRVVIRWLAYLDRVAAIYAKGRFSVRPVQAGAAPAEIRALAQTLDAMADAIVTRDASLRDTMAQKDAMMREIHHRVKNNLQVITSLLNMQQRALSDPGAREAMSDTRQRITALALIYRALYQSPDLRRVDVRQFLEELLGQFSAGDGGGPGRIAAALNADDLEIDPDKLAPLALFAVEAISATRKHALHAGGGIKVAFRVTACDVLLEVSADGEAPAEDPSASGGVSRTLMTAFARQLRGGSSLEPKADGGLVIRLSFPTPPLAMETPKPFQLSARNPSAA